MEFRAEMRYLRVSPQKARLVLELIKGRRVEEARNTLAFTNRQPVREERDRERRAAHEAYSSGAAGARVSLSAAYCAHYFDPGGAREERGRGPETRGGCPDSRSGSGEGQAAGSGSEGVGEQE
jgi:large subunit ribosomal protein L22